MKNIFTKTFLPKVKSNTFDLSHDHKLSFGMGELVPTCVMDVLPGDKFEISVENMLRFAPLVSPVMHKVNVSTHYFFVPNRILWDNWEDFITGNDPDNVIEAPLIYDLNDNGVGSINDHMGIPVGITDGDLTANALPAAAYFKIWNDYYRDQNLQEELQYKLNDGEDNDGVAIRANGPCLKRAYEHDYFTSALPFAQKGDAVTLPLTNNEAVDVTLKSSSLNPVKGVSPIGSTINGTVSATPDLRAGQNLMQLDPQGSLEVDINEEATDINTLRRAFRLQEWLEKNARGGTRYIESILSHFGVKSSDARLQRSEYIGGAKQRMVISEVLSTAETIDSADTPVNPVGQMAGHGISVGGGKTFKYTAEEHGFIIGIINVQPETAYQQGLNRMFSRPDRLDYFWESFAHIGEQEILQKELYCLNSTPELNNATFGYIPRYSEYRYMDSRVSGEMRSSLNYWTMSRIFSNSPQLNAQFIEVNNQETSDRCFAVSGEIGDTIYAHVFNNIKAVRKIPKFGIPSF
jgi:hypothetical protein